MSRRKVAELFPQDQPEYRAETVGLEALSTQELLQMVCRFHYTDTAPELMARAGSLRELTQMSVEEMAAVPQVTFGMAQALQAAFELGRRAMLEQDPDRLQIRSPEDCAAILLPQFGDKDQEHLVVLILDTRHQLISQQVIYKGSVNTALVRIAEIFKEAIRRNSPCLVISHNHPSGDPAPSVEDLALTRQVVEVGRMLDIQVLDHIITARSRYVSLRERGLGFEAQK